MLLTNSLLLSNKDNDSHTRVEWQQIQTFSSQQVNQIQILKELKSNITASYLLQHKRTIPHLNALAKDRYYDMLMFVNETETEI